MRKLYFLSLLILGSSAAHAQFTLTSSAHGITTGHSITYHNFATAVGRGTSGANVTWDLSGNTFNTTSPVTEVYTTPLGYHTANFPRTNMVMYNSQNDTTYFRQTTGNTVDSLIIMGLHFNSIQGVGKLAFNDPNLLLKYPYDYNMSPISDMLSGNNTNGNSTTDIDAYGTLKLSSGSYSTIRVRYNLDLTIQTGFGPVSVNMKDFTWFTQSQRDPIMKIRVITSLLGNDSTAMANSLFTGIEANNSLNGAFTLYPNPSTDQVKMNLNLEKSGNTTVEIYSNSGARVYSENLGMLSAGGHSFDLSTANVAAGVYTVRVISDGETGIKKLVVQ